jgi:hypothetical protein
MTWTHESTGAIGVACDVYHVWWDPELSAQIKRAGANACSPFTFATGSSRPMICCSTAA